MQEDLRYIYNQVNRSSEIHFEADVQTIEAKCSTFRDYFHKYHLSRCLSFCDAMKKVWWTFQARGILPDGVDLPVQGDACESLSSTDFVNITLSVYKANRGTFDKHKQKNAYVKMMYDEVPLFIKQHVRNLLQKDFDLFGYNPSPEIVFPRTDP